MLSPEYYDHCADDILEQYAALEDAIISSMIKKLMKHGYMTESAKHQAEVIQETGMIYGDVVQIIANYTDATANQVKALFEDAGVRTVEIDNEVYREVGKSPVDIRQSDSMKQILEAGCRKTFNEMWNLTKTLAVITQREYIKACNNAYMQVSSGAFSYDEAIKNAVKNAAVGGLEVEYPSGSKSKLDVAIRRSVLTGVGQTCAEIGKMNAEANGCHLMEITAHSGARPGHVVWQGQLVTLTGEDAHKVIDGMYVFTLYEIGYGDVTGFKGANCRHDWYPYEPGFSKPNYTKEELEELNARNIEYNGKMYTEYEISQMQRYRERHIRELKRQTAKAQDIVDFTDNPELKATAQANYQATASRLKKAEQGLKDFCKATGRDREKSREQVLGFSHSEAQRAVHAAKNYANNKLTSETKGGIINIASNAHSRNFELENTIKRCINSKLPIFADDLLRGVSKIKPPHNEYVVGLHGSDTSTWIFGVKIDVKILSNIIKARKDYHGEDIYLFSCNTGNTTNTEDCFAQLLADKLGVVVYAPTEYGVVWSNGRHYSGKRDFTPSGEIKPFKPRK